MIDNESDEFEILEYLVSLKYLYFGEVNILVIFVVNIDGKFNFVVINNCVVEKVKIEYIFFLNNDIEIIFFYWLS